jgi:hypothetical protein
MSQPYADACDHADAEPLTEVEQPEPVASFKAEMSFRLGLWAIVLFPLYGIPGLAAIALGLLGLADVRRGEGRVTGDRLAITGIVLGGVSVVLFAVGWLLLGRCTTQVESVLCDNPTLVGRLGAVEPGGFALDYLASLREADSDVWVFDVRGRDGTGVVTAQTEGLTLGEGKVFWAKLTLPSGEVLDLVTERDPAR